jgi:hypothetical protein
MSANISISPHAEFALLHMKDTRFIHASYIFESRAVVLVINMCLYQKAYSMYVRMATRSG